MNRRKFIGLLSTGISAGNAFPLEAMTKPQSELGQKSGRPNFIFMICDDLAFRTIHALNNSEVHTPNLDRFVASGCAFTHCFHQGSWSPAVCTPSRTMLNSGLSAFHAQEGIDEVHSWGQTLGNAGYDTYMCGKWHLEPTILQRSFKEMGPVGPGMFPSTPENGAAYYRPSSGNNWQPWDETLKGHWLHTNLWLEQIPDRIKHADILYTDCFIDHLLNKAAKRDTPFFMYLGFNSPHDPRQSFKEHLALYPQEKIQVPPNFLPEHPFDQGDSKIRDEVLAPFPRTKEAVQLHRREYYALITLLDAQVGRILDALKQSGKADNTYVILTADHGLAVGEFGLMGKQNMYDCSVRMPLLISGPGIHPGRRVDELVYQHSMYATTCDLAQVSIPKAVEFPSLVSLLHGGNQALHDAVFCYYRDFQRMLRTKDYKVIVYPQINRTQLFDLKQDPWEMHDLSDDPAYASIKSDFNATVVTHARGHG